MEAFRALTATHRPTIAECGIRALDVGVRPANADESLLKILVRRRTGETKPEKSWAVEDAFIESYDDVPPARAAQMKAVLGQKDFVQRAAGIDGAFFAVIQDAETGTANSAPIGYTSRVVSSRKTPWKELKLLLNLNSGVVV